MDKFLILFFLLLLGYFEVSNGSYIGIITLTLGSGESLEKHWKWVGEFLSYIELREGRINKIAPND